MELSYVSRNLRKTISYRDIVLNPALKSEANRKMVSDNASTLSNQENIFDKKFSKISIKSKDAYVVRDIEAALILKLLATNLKRIHKISPSNRVQVVTTLIAFLKESSPYSIHRFDIKHFYESINRSRVEHKLNSQGIASKKSRNLVKAYFYELDALAVDGLARGLGISATLSEYVLEDVDKKIKSLDRVFFYARFVDDIVVVTDLEYKNEDLKNIINEQLPDSLELHTVGKKLFHGKVVKPKDNPKNAKEPKQLSFEYLGYKFLITNHNHIEEKFIDIKRRNLVIDISEDKIEKLKKRLIQSFTNYLASPKKPSDFQLLQKRLKFLTGNYELDRNLHTGKVKSGIYYNYSLINSYNELHNLDKFLRGLLFSKKHPLSLRIQKAIPIGQRRSLAHFSFVSGHKKKRFHNFRYIDLKDIKKVW